jgi:hypothetical protein
MNISPHSEARINYLHDPQGLDILFDTLQEIGIPMGSDTWAQQAAMHIKMLEEERNTLRKILLHLDEARQEQAKNMAPIWRDAKNKWADASRQRIRERDGE